MTDRKTGLEVVIKVQGFYEAKRWIYDLIGDKLIKCRGGGCHNPATHVFWQDRAEWYPLCDEHREHGQMWTGSTNWNPRVFSLAVLPEPAKKWYSELAPELKKKIKLQKYDATDYYALMADGRNPIDTILIDGKKDDTWRIDCAIYALKNGQFAYEIVQRRGNSTWYHAITGMYPEPRDAFEAARKEWNKGKARP